MVACVLVKKRSYACLFARDSIRNRSGPDREFDNQMLRPHLQPQAQHRCRPLQIVSPETRTGI